MQYKENTAFKIIIPMIPTLILLNNYWTYNVEIRDVKFIFLCTTRFKDNLQSKTAVIMRYKEK